MIQAHYQVLEVYAAATVYYLLLTSVIELGQRRLEGHFGKSSLPYERH
jgi:polar amino acid transport system permease protein